MGRRGRFYLISSLLVLSVIFIISKSFSGTLDGPKAQQESLPDILTTSPKPVSEIASDFSVSISNISAEELSNIKDGAIDVANNVKDKTGNVVADFSNSMIDISEGMGEEFNSLTDIPVSSGSDFSLDVLEKLRIDKEESADASATSDDNEVITNNVEISEDYDSSVYQKVKYVRAVDGDTIIVEIDNNEYSVRLIGINTPESVASEEYLEYKETTNSEEGKAASNYTKELLKGYSYLYMVKDTSDTDRYGRLLRYVWLQIPSDRYNIDEVKTKMLNGILVYNKIAEAVEYKPDTEYSDIFSYLYNN